MTEQETILIVDDTRDGRLILNKMLQGTYKILEADSGQACLDIIDEQQPDLILLDIEMPGMNGYETCKQIKANESSQNIPIIFVSGFDSESDRLKGFEVGANDFFIKPFKKTELEDKILSTLLRQRVFKETQQQSNIATNMAMEAMTVTSELGQILNFVKNVQALNSPQSVGQEVIRIAQEFGLRSSAMISLGELFFVGCQSDSLEANLMQHVAKSEERIFSVGIRTVVKNQHIVLLLKNMPLDNEKLYGRLKDHIAVFMDIADGHLVTLEERDKVIKQREQFLKQIIEVAEQQIDHTNNKILVYEKSTYDIMQGMLNKLEGMLFSLGLDEDQENKLISLANEASLKLAESSESTHNLGKDLGIILEKLVTFQQQ